MRTSLLILLFSVAFASCGVNRNVYKSSEFSTKAAGHQTIAILPFKINQTGHVGKKESLEEIKATNEKWAYVFQETLLSYTLRSTSKNRKGPMVSFQGAQKTNAILKEQSLTIDDLYNKRPEEVAQLLGVDAVIMTTLDKNKNFSDGVAYGLAAGKAILTTLSGPNLIGLGGVNANDMNLNSYLYDAKDGKLLWKTFRQGSNDLPTQTNELVEYYSNWIARKLPYRS